MTIVVNCTVCTAAVGVGCVDSIALMLCERCALVVTNPDQPWAASQALAKARAQLFPPVDPAVQPGLFGPVTGVGHASQLSDADAVKVAAGLLDSGSRIGGSFGLVDRLDAIASDIRDASTDAAALDAIAPVLTSLFHAADKIRTAQVTLLRSHP